MKVYPKENLNDVGCYWFFGGILEGVVHRLVCRMYFLTNEDRPESDADMG